MRAEPRADSDWKVYIHGGVCYIDQDRLPKNREAAARYKLLLPRAGNPGTTILGRPKLSEPGSCSSNTYVVAMPPDRPFTREEADNCLSYVQTKFFRYLVAIRTSTQDMPPKAYAYVPVQDFTRPWTDGALYEKYGLTQKEREAVEDAIAAM